MVNLLYDVRSTVNSPGDNLMNTWTSVASPLSDPSSDALVFSLILSAEKLLDNPGEGGNYCVDHLIGI